MYYHGTGSENAGRAYTEAPMQHVQRNALRKKCMKSTFTLLEIHTSKHFLFLRLSIFYILAHTHMFTYLFSPSSASFSLILLLFMSLPISLSDTEIPYVRSYKVQLFLENSSRIVPPRLSRFVHFCLRLFRTENAY